MDDFTRASEKDDVLYFIINYLNKDTAKALNEMISKRYSVVYTLDYSAIKVQKYELCDWNFAFEYIEN